MSGKSSRNARDVVARSDRRRRRPASMRRRPVARRLLARAFHVMRRGESRKDHAERVGAGLDRKLDVPQLVQPQNLMRVDTFERRRSTRAGSLRTHQRLADQKAPRAGRAQALDVFGPRIAAFADGE